LKTPAVINLNILSDCTRAHLAICFGFHDFRQ
jgi:hypothetical protein